MKFVKGREAFFGLTDTQKSDYLSSKVNIFRNGESIVSMASA
jgi:hypothetical protein